MENTSSNNKEKLSKSRLRVLAYRKSYIKNVLKEEEHIIDSNIKKINILTKNIKTEEGEVNEHSKDTELSDDMSMLIYATISENQNEINNENQFTQNEMDELINQQHDLLQVVKQLKTNNDLVLPNGNAFIINGNL